MYPGTITCDECGRTFPNGTHGREQYRAHDCAREGVAMGVWHIVCRDCDELELLTGYATGALDAKHTHEQAFGHDVAAGVVE